MEKGGKPRDKSAVLLHEVRCMLMACRVGHRFGTDLTRIRDNAACPCRHRAGREPELSGEGLAYQREGLQTGIGG